MCNLIKRHPIQCNQPAVAVVIVLHVTHQPGVPHSHSHGAVSLAPRNRTRKTLSRPTDIYTHALEQVCTTKTRTNATRECGAAAAHRPYGGREAWGEPRTNTHSRPRARKSQNLLAQLVRACCRFFSTQSAAAPDDDAHDDVRRWYGFRDSVQYYSALVCVCVCVRLFTFFTIPQERSLAPLTVSRTVCLCLCAHPFSRAKGVFFSKTPC